MGFDLNRHVARWRHDLARRAAFDDAHLDELEAHLWDEIERLQADGLDERQAFLRATVRLGHADALAHEFHKATVWGERPRWQHPFWQLMMGKNYLTVAWRNLRRERAFSVINIGGLALGLACCLVLLQYVSYERSYDRHHARADRIHRVAQAFLGEDGSAVFEMGLLRASYGHRLQEDFPDLTTTRIHKPYRAPSLSVAAEAFVEPQFYFAEANAFDVFSLPLVQGDPATALTAPDGLVLTETSARKYFGPSTDPLGQIVRYTDNEQVLDLTVTGILTDPPPTTHWSFEGLISFSALTRLYGVDFLKDGNAGANFATYVLLPEGQDPAQVEAALPGFLDRHHPAREGRAASARMRLWLQPLPDIHLYSHLDHELAPNGDVRYVYLFAVIAGFILLIACINFINLTTARSFRRAREVGVRKVLGALRRHVRVQFFAECLLMVALATGLALGGLALVLPLLGTWLGPAFALTPSTLLASVGKAGMLMGIVAVCAGAYPALYLAGFKPIAALKGVPVSGAQARLRGGLVVVQFAIAVTLVVGTLVIFNQLDYIQAQRLGFSEAQQVVLAGNTQAGGAAEATLRARLLRHPGIEAVTFSSRVPGDRLLDGGTVRRADQATGAAYVVIDPFFFDTYEMPLVAGRTYQPDRATDSTEALVLNEAAVRALGWSTPEAALGQPVRFNGERRVIGVVQDVHFESLHQPIGPVVFLLAGFQHDKVTVRLRPGLPTEALAVLEDAWAGFRPGYPFSYSFLDARLDRQYRTDQRLGRILGGFALLALFIACLGLFGMAAYMAEQRTKEIGIRKTLGATGRDITVLFASRLMRPILIAFVLAVPLAYLGLQYWLETFAYHAPLGVQPFAWAGGTVLLIAGFTISYQVIRLVGSNPVDSLRSA